MVALNPAPFDPILVGIRGHGPLPPDHRGGENAARLS